MSKILLTYEFGGGLGHLSRLMEIGKRLAAQHSLFFLIPDNLQAHSLIHETPFPSSHVSKVVSWCAIPSAASKPTDTLADVLALFDYGDTSRLQTACLQWLDVLHRVSPDLIISDFSPTLRLVSQGRVPTVVVGNGYTVPPSSRLLPPIRPWENIVSAQSRCHEAELLLAVNRIRSQLSRTAVDHLADLLHGEHTFICTIKEFDPYQAIRSTAYSWPFNVPQIKGGNGVSNRRGGIFCYLQSSHPALAAVLAALNAVDVDCEIFVSGMDPGDVARRCSRRARVHQKPADLSIALAGNRVLIHHAGLGTSYAGLMAATPQVVLPSQLEHRITTRGLSDFGVAIGLSNRTNASGVKGALEEVLDNPKYRLASEAALEAMRSRRDDSSAEKIVQACESLL